MKMPDSDEAPNRKNSSKSLLKELASKLGALQREAQTYKIPVLVIIEGLDASKKGRLINEILLEIDSRSFKVYSTHASHTEPRKYPLLHRFWTHTPAKGRIQFYDRSAYYLVLDSWAEGKLHDEQVEHYWEDINRFERQLHDDGVQIVKIFLTIPKKEQAKRFRRLESNPKTAWRVTPKDWRRHRQYRAYLATVMQMIDQTDQEHARWHVVDTKAFRGALIEVYHRIIDKLESAVAQAKRAKSRPNATKANVWIPYKGRNYLAETIFEPSMDRDIYKRTLKKRQSVIHELVHEVHSREVPVVIVYCGWDAAGKGGCIKRLVQSIDPRGYDVVPIAAPTKLELDHHYLWRFWREMPPRGKITIFDRSWYGRVLVERVESLCSNDEWQRAYQEINEMESHLTDFGTCLIKFWLHIDPETQLARFEARQEDPNKQWKITEEDWRNREKWELYEESVNQMIDQTSAPKAPWRIIPANCKMRARIRTLDTVIASLRASLKRTKKTPL